MSAVPAVALLLAAAAAPSKRHSEASMGLSFEYPADYGVTPQGVRRPVVTDEATGEPARPASSELNASGRRWSLKSYDLSGSECSLVRIRAGGSPPDKCAKADLAASEREDNRIRRLLSAVRWSAPK